MKDPRVEELKPKFQEQKASAFQLSNSADTSKQAWKEKKKKKEKRERRNKERRLQDTTLATRVNTTNTLEGHSSRGRVGGRRS